MLQVSLNRLQWENQIFKYFFQQNPCIALEVWALKHIIH